VIAALAGQGHSAKTRCQTPGVAASGFFYWRNGPPTMLELRTEQLGGLIADITTPPTAERASSTAAQSSTRILRASSVGRSTASKPPRW